MLAQSLGAGFRDLRQFSLRRTAALSRVAFKEAIRRKALYAFLVFAVLLLLAGWYLDPNTEHPARLYLGFVMTATNFLVLIMALFLSAFSLPQDIQNRTIYTVVTKPARSGEIVLGKILGFVGVGTVMVGAMCVTGYVFVVRGLDHDHEIAPGSLKPKPSDIRPGEMDGYTARTTNSGGHEHKVRIYADGSGGTLPEHGHYHVVEKVGEDQYRIGPPEGLLTARVPVYGSLRFLDRSGRPKEKGINVGNEWTYRSYIEGKTLAAAIWTFDNVTPRRFGDALPMEMTLRVFRTHKGTISRAKRTASGRPESAEELEAAVIRGSFQLRNPDNPRVLSEPQEFDAREFTIQQVPIPRQLPALDGQRTLDLYEDLVTQDGRLEIIVRCEDRGQYFGMAKADMYLKAAEGPFWVNFVKGYMGIWLQMVLITCFGVVLSTFLSGPIAALATLLTFLLGYFWETIKKVATGEIEGGGMLESGIRLVKQKNTVTPLEEGWLTDVVYVFDDILHGIMVGVSYALPDYGKFSAANYVAYGYDIPFALVLQQTLTMLSYLAVLSVAGYFFLKSREIAA